MRRVIDLTHSIPPPFRRESLVGSLIILRRTRQRGRLAWRIQDVNRRPACNGEVVGGAAVPYGSLAFWR